MKYMVNQMISGTFRSIRRRFEAKASSRDEVTRVAEVLERVVEGTDPAIRYVPGYRKKLFDVIAGSLEFAEQLVTEIPGAIEVSRRNFVSNPYVNAFFANIQDLQTIFSQSSEIRDFLEDDSGSRDNGCYALLCMRKSEKTVFGVELVGDVLRHDIQQTAVNFSDHRLYSPATTESGTREGLRHCLIQGLGSHALERIMRMKLENHRLQQEHHTLNVRLRQIQGRNGAARDAHTASETETIRRKLRQVEQALLNSRTAAPEESLHQVHTVFGQPDEFMRINKSTLRLNKMCIKIDDGTEQPCNTISLTEVIFGEEAPRVVTLAKFPAEELLPAAQLWEQGFFTWKGADTFF